MLKLRRPTINTVVMKLVYADLIFFTAAGLITPIMAVFYVDEINNGTIAVAGLVTALFWVVKSAVQVPVSLYADNKKGEYDDFAMMFVGYIISALVPLCYYAFVTEVWQVYLVEVLHGIGYGLMVPTYLAMYTRHIDRQRENFEWTLHSNAVGLGYAAAAAIGGVMADRFGFRPIFLATSIIMMMSPVVLFFIRKHLYKSDGTVPDPELAMRDFKGKR
jgi:MFS family permease